MSFGVQCAYYKLNGKRYTVVANILTTTTKNGETEFIWTWRMIWNHTNANKNGRHIIQNISVLSFCFFFFHSYYRGCMEQEKETNRKNNNHTVHILVMTTMATTGTATMMSTIVTRPMGMAKTKINATNLLSSWNVAAFFLDEKSLNSMESAAGNSVAA